MTTPIDLLVGGPTFDRGWAQSHWFGHVEAACLFAGQNLGIPIIPGYIFVGDPRDNPTQQIILDTTQSLGRRCHAIWAEESPHKYVREWTEARYKRMVYLRNALLGGVRELHPTHFLSLDSDIFLAQDGLLTLLNTMEQYEFDAVGGKCYMTPPGSGTWAPSWANFGPGENLLREECATVKTVDVIMAIKLMNPKAYAVDYAWHHQGEDPGWCKAAKDAGCYLGFDGRIANKHVMLPELLHVPDERVGW